MVFVSFAFSDGWITCCFMSFSTVFQSMGRILFPEELEPTSP